jgi:hypothetical protein
MARGKHGARGHTFNPMVVGSSPTRLMKLNESPASIYAAGLFRLSSSVP